MQFKIPFASINIDLAHNGGEPIPLSKLLALMLKKKEKPTYTGNGVVPDELNGAVSDLFERDYGRA